MQSTHKAWDGEASRYGETARKRVQILLELLGRPTTVKAGSEATIVEKEFRGRLGAVVRRAGWTTLAEGIFFEALVESMLTHTRDLTQLHQRLKAAFEAVQEK